MTTMYMWLLHVGIISISILDNMKIYEHILDIIFLPLWETVQGFVVHLVSDVSVPKLQKQYVAKNTVETRRSREAESLKMH